MLLAYYLDGAYSPLWWEGGVSFTRGVVFFFYALWRFIESTSTGDLELLASILARSQLYVLLLDTAVHGILDAVISYSHDPLFSHFPAP